MALLLQVDTLGKKALVGIALTYISLIVLIPFAAVFVQVRWGCQQQRLCDAHLV